MAYSEVLAQRVRESLAHRRDVTEKRMFGGIAFMVAGHMACGPMDDRLIVRIGEEATKRHIGTPHVTAMDFTGRVMKAFATIGPGGLRTKAQLAKWVNMAAAFAEASAKAPKRVKGRARVERGPEDDGRTSPRKARTRSAAATIDKDILAYNAAQAPGDRRICDALSAAIDRNLPGAECKIWHRHPVWFLEGNPIVGYSKLKDSVRLLFWSGQSFDEPGLTPEGSFKAAEARFTSAEEISLASLKRWLKKSIAIQWDYKNIVKRRGRLDRLK